MSFSSELKQQLSLKRPSTETVLPQCLGMLLPCREFSFDKIILQTGSKEVAECFCSLLRLGFDIITDIRKGGTSRPTFCVEIASSADRKRILYRYKAKQDKPLSVFDFPLKNEGSIGAFVRGAFLSGGSMSDPEKEYRIDFSFKSEQTARDFAELLSLKGIVSRITHRAGKYLVYIKDSTMLEDLLTLMGAPNETLNLINVKIYKSVRNKSNRENNCETSNILKSANAAFAQTKAIKKLKESGRLELLPEELYEAATLRLENPDSSLAELCRLTGNRLTRSGLSHRFKRITEISKEVK